MEVSAKTIQHLVEFNTLSRYIWKNLQERGAEEARNCPAGKDFGGVGLDNKSALRL
jgi:hypothetical protein